MHSHTRKRLFTVLLGVAWLLGIGWGLRVMLAYENSPGNGGTPPDQWPAASAIEREPGRAMLVMLAHPHCPCTRASIAELAGLMARIQDDAVAYVLFWRPGNAADQWDKSDLWQSAAAIPGVKVLWDEDGFEAQRFRVETSGHTLLFAPDGRLIFSGGITASRGHRGDNAGRRAILALLTGGTATHGQTLVFGCSLHGPKNPPCLTLCSK